MQGLWGLAFGTSPLAILLLMNALAVLIAALVFVTLRASLGAGAGFVGGALFLMFPIVQTYTGRVMAELPLALFTLLAALSFGRFLDRARLRDSLAFGLFASLAILTKGNGIALALLPLFALALGRRWELLRRPALWAAAVPVVLLCAPWYAFTLSGVSGTWDGGATPSLGYASRALGFYLASFVALGGIPLALCALLGIAAGLRPGPANGPWIALAALLPSLLVVHTLIPPKGRRRS
jgi:4-amino-4-deoxy-L-arabinose transferase-like glycosyltransferase